MADFANYTPGEYAKEHIRITPTTLADGRDFFYLDDDPEFVSGAKTRELKDPRPLDYRFAPHLDADGNEVPYVAPQMRRDPLTGELDSDGHRPYEPSDHRRPRRHRQGQPAGRPQAR